MCLTIFLGTELHGVRGRRNETGNVIKLRVIPCLKSNNAARNSWKHHLNPEKPDVPLNKNDAFQKVQKRHVQEKR